ncbi:MAG: hypothetical protein E7773_08025 [Sphingomonas sp.]|uniref:hypothetical protein n=1 Tax=Sphingomonas sp. TaxID=28214 RepID=UPI001201BB00|nr:hypothetical protein [Sphingomonas sp.]THD35887.1 MAG: hypothetical protein E7773_08025 [Sphingomonas sp.]
MTGLLVHPAVLAALAYLAVTLLFQFRPFTTRAQGLDLLGIVPRWKFFIPQTGRFEVAIELRCGSHEGDLGAWTPVRIYPPRHALTWLWFPEQHRAAMLWLSAHRVAVRASRGNHAGAPETLAYQTLVRHLQLTEPARSSGLFQFALVHQDDGVAVFTSRLHGK